MTTHGIGTEDVRGAFPAVGLTGFVYFLRCGDRGPIKIGFAADPEARCASHQVSNPHPLVLLGAYPGTMADERALHLHFRADRVRGEWFRSSRGLQREIKVAQAAWHDHLRRRNNAATAEVLELIASRREAA